MRAGSFRRTYSALARSSRCKTGLKSQTCAVLGAQWGDEGKGKLADVLAKDYDIVGRFNGGSNAGHTIVVEGKKFAFHLLPCGLIYEHTLNVLGNGVVVDLDSFFEELEPLKEAGIPKVDARVKVSNRAHLLFGFHKIIDGILENRKGDKKIGTTQKGIGPAYMTKALRSGIRVGDLVDWDSFQDNYFNLVKTIEVMFQFEYKEASAEIEKLKKYREHLLKHEVITDTTFLINNSLDEGKRLIAEGANAAMLDLDFGSYPFVTSSTTTAGNVATGLGVAGSKLESVIGVVKAYTTRVGSGPFPTELCYDTHPIGIHLQTVGREIGVTTGRKRRCGWLDAALLRYSNMLNDYSSVNITKLDVLDQLEEVKICVSYTNKASGKTLPLGRFPSTMIELGEVQPVYETFKGWKKDLTSVEKYSDLPSEAKDYLDAVEKFSGVEVSWIGVGPGREQMLLKE